MRTKRVRSIQSTLMIAFFSMLVLIFFVITLVFTITQAHRINQKAIDLMSQKVNSIYSFIELDTEKLNTLAQNIAYSELIKDHFITYLENDNSNLSPEIADYDDVHDTKVLIDLMTAVIGPNRPANQVYLYSFTEGTFGVGLDTRISQTQVTDMPWFEQLNESKYKRIYCWDTDARLLPYFSYPEGATCLSLCTMYYNQYNRPIGVIEVKRPVSELIDHIQLLSGTYHEDVYIYDGTGKCVYSTGDSSDTYFQILTESGSVANEVTHVTYKNKKELFYRTSSTNQFTTLVVVDTKHLYSTIFDYIQKNIFIFFVVSLIAFAFSYLVSHIMTTPVTQIYHQIRNFRLNSASQTVPKSFPNINTGILEFNTLYAALIEMQHQVQISMNHEIVLQNQEMQSRMLALQTQMNPHFLYNSLATIQSLAGENMNKEIIDMCQGISQILRYISSDKTMFVPIKDEIKHMKNYLNCVKIRYEEDLTYHISIPSQMQELKVPKLCLQPIVENSIKYATKSVRPPWNIAISGMISANKWEIHIADNGPGFSEEFLQKFSKKIDDIDRTGLLPSLEIDGMGLLNIYVRLKLLYKDHHIFTIKNAANGGALVIIGAFFS